MSSPNPLEEYYNENEFFEVRSYIEENPEVQMLDEFLKDFSWNTYLNMKTIPSIAHQIVAAKDAITQKTLTIWMASADYT